MGKAGTAITSALRDATSILKTRGATTKSVSGALAGLKQRHGLLSADLVAGAAPGAFHVHLQRMDGDTPEILLNEGEEHDLENELYSQWDAIEEHLAAGNEEAHAPQKTTLSPESARLSLATLIEFASASPASPSAMNDAKDIAKAKVAEALAATTGDDIYALLGEGQAAVNALYPGRAKPLHVHHVEHVHDNPATFPKTRLERLKAKMGKRVRAKSQVPGSDEHRIARIADADRRRVEISKWAEEQLRLDIEAGPDQLSEVNMWVMPTGTHLGGFHGKAAKAFNAENARKEAEARKL